MSNHVVSPDGVGAALEAILKEYGERVTETMEDIIPEVAKEGAKRIKAEAPKGKTGKYARGWTTKIENGRLTISAIIHGKHGTYQLAHLLEKGHALRGGGRSRTTAIEHIAPVEKWVTEEVPKRIIERLS